MADKDPFAYTFNIGKLKPVNALCQRYGWKGIIYGGPGTGKTPLLMSARSAVHAFAESGLTSVRNVTTQPGTMLLTYADMRDYILWATRSNEAKQFELKTFDSFTQMAETIHEEERRATKNGQKAYGEMAEKMVELMSWLFFAPDCNVLGLCKETLLEIDGDTKRWRPLFPGRVLDAAVPHLFDSFWRLEFVPDGKGGITRAIRTRPSYNAFARERTNNMDELEPPDLTYLLSKVSR